MLEALPLLENSDDFVFDNQILAQAMFFGYRIGEVSCPTKYFAEASSIDWKRSIVYGLGVLRTSLCYRLQRWNMVRSAFLSPDGRRLPRAAQSGAYYQQLDTAPAATLPAEGAGAAAVSFSPSQRIH